MPFKTRMVLYFFGLVIILSIATSLLYYGYSSARVQENARQSLSNYAQEMTRQFDGSVNMMDYAIRMLIYDVDVLNSLVQLSNVGQDPDYPVRYGNAAMDTLRARLSIGSLMDFYRVIIFNRYGNVIANRGDGNREIRRDVDWRDIPWLEQLNGTRGKNTLIAPHMDDWGDDAQLAVYSLVKEVQGNNLGYIEVQYELAHLDEILSLPDQAVRIALFYEDGGLFYASDAAISMQEWQRWKNQAENGDTRSVNGSHLFALWKSEQTDMQILTVMPTAALAEQVGYIVPATLLIGGLFASVSFVFVYLISSYLTRPIRQVRQLIDNTRLDTMGMPIDYAHSIRYKHAINEIDALVCAYQSMMARLSKAIQTETQLAQLHLKVQFDVLQAQVNPHFLYNVLNVISQRGMNVNDDAICEICSNLAAILRYSTNTKQKLATIEEELLYLGRYAQLQKMRYQHKFEFESTMDDAVRGLQIPRLTIQQLVENSIQHGYENSSESMRIRVRVYREAGQSVICVRDNGEGFREESLSALNAQFARMHASLGAQGSKAFEMEIGGMGLANIYARLYLTFAQRLKISLFNEAGAVVLVQIADENQENERNVSSVDCGR